MRRINFVGLVLILAAGCAAEPVYLNQIQFVGSHNSYKMAMDTAVAAQLKERNPQAAQALDYAHPPLSEQLDLGLRKLELDVFYDPAGGRFPVGHVQQIDMNSQCSPLRRCLEALRLWSAQHPKHVPIWISFNAKDGKIAGLPDPEAFTAEAFARLDQVVLDVLAGQLLTPAMVKSPAGNLDWPALSAARGKIILILDEGGGKRDMYAANWRERPMFINVPAEHPAAAIMIINDPIAQGDVIRQLVEAGYMVRTRADADTREARTGDTSRRDAAFASGAQAISTDYYRPDPRLDATYQVRIPGGVRCNPVNSGPDCNLD